MAISICYWSNLYQEDEYELCFESLDGRHVYMHITDLESTTLNLDD